MSRRAAILTLSCVVAAGALGAAPPAKARATLVVTGGTVITMDAQRRVLSPGAVAIDGTTIVAVDTPQAIAARYAAASVIQAGGTVVLPGLINTHGHAAMVMYRGLADDLALMDWLQKYIFPAEAKTVSPEMVRIGTRLAALEMLQSGTTLHTDMYYFEEEVAKATKEAGMRGVLGQTVIGFPVADAKTPAEGLARAERFMEAFRGDPLVTATVAPHSMYTVDAATLTATRDLARKYGVPLLTHLAETRGEVVESLQKHQLTPAAYLASLGFWDTPALAAHGVHLSDEDIAILVKHRVALSHNPESNMKLASGAAPVTRVARGRPRRRPRHRRGGQQQRPRHVRGDAPGGLPAQAVRGRPHGRVRADGARDGHHRRGGRARHGRPAWFARSREAGGPDRGVDELGAPDADVQPRVAPGLRDARRRCPHDDRERAGPDAGPAGADARTPPPCWRTPGGWRRRSGRPWSRRRLSRAWRGRAGSGTAPRSRGRSPRRSDPRS